MTHQAIKQEDRFHYVSKPLAKCYNFTLKCYGHVRLPIIKEVYLGHPHLYILARYFYELASK